MKPTTAEIEVRRARRKAIHTKSGREMMAEMCDTDTRVSAREREREREREDGNKEIGGTVGKKRDAPPMAAPIGMVVASTSVNLLCLCDVGEN